MVGECGRFFFTSCERRELVTKSRPWPVIGRTIFFTSDKNRPTRDEIYFIDFWRENLSMYRINVVMIQRDAASK